jgi:hypothetical protein
VEVRALATTAASMKSTLMSSAFLLKDREKRHLMARMEMRRLILTLQILLGHFDIQQSHIGIAMAQQFH